MNKMKHILLFLPVVMLLAACTQDELTDNGQGTPLPEPIPLQLTASIGEAVATPATRATTVDGQWPAEGGTVYVQISETEDGLDNATAMKYTVDANGNLTPPSDAETLYWENTTQTFYVRAWYPGGRTDWDYTPKKDIQWTAGIDQSTEAGLAKDDFLYTYQTLTFSTQPHKLDFKHLMSKITINLVNSDYLMQYAPEKVSVSLASTDFYKAWLYEGTFKDSGSELNLSEKIGSKNIATITPFKLSADGTYYASYEAIVIPQEFTVGRGIQVKVDNTIYQWSVMSSSTLQMESGNEYTFNITVKEQGLEVSAGSSIDWGTGSNGTSSVTLPIEIDLSQATDVITIDDNKAYLLTGSGSYPVTINGDATVILQGVSLTTSTGNAISVESGSPTIHVKGTNNSVTGYNAGIYVAENSTVTITGDSRNDILTAKGGNSGCGIGGYVQQGTPWASYACGNISITNVTVYAHGSGDNVGNYSPGIGCGGNAACGTITIDNAIVHAYGYGKYNANWSAPAIGCGAHLSQGCPSSIPVVIIQNDSEVHAHRGENNANLPTDYIGWPGDPSFSTVANGSINCGTGGGVYNSTVYCYTGDTPDKTVVYDENGNEL